MRDKQAKLGTISLIGAIACATIASELYSDLVHGTRHFPLPKGLTAVSLGMFLAFTCLEVNKVRNRAGAILRVSDPTDAIP